MQKPIKGPWQSFLEEFTEKLILLAASGFVIWWAIEELIDFLGGR